MFCGSLLIALLVLGVLVAPNGAMADSPEGVVPPFARPCSDCYNGCAGVSYPDCSGTNASCNKYSDCGDCKCKGGSGGQTPPGEACVCY